MSSAAFVIGNLRVNKILCKAMTDYCAAFLKLFCWWQVAKMTYYAIFIQLNIVNLVGWSFWVYRPLRQYFSLYRAISQREGEIGEKR